MKNRKIDIVITHKNCPDGTGSALVALKYCKETGQLPPQVIPSQYGDTYPNIQGKHVLMCDFSFNEKIIKDMFLEAESLVILDHHVTAKEALTNLPLDIIKNENPLNDIIFDMNKSGAMLTWNFLYPDIEAPRIISYIQDRDLWWFKEESSKEFSAGFILHAQEDILRTDSLTHLFTDDFVKRTIVEGTSILKYQNSIISQASKRVDEVPRVTINGYVGTSTNSTHLISELGNMYANREDFSLQYFFTDNDIVFSLRSIGDFDVSKLAAMYDGGGHKNAAGFSMSLSEFDYESFFLHGIIKKKNEWTRIKQYLKF